MIKKDRYSGAYLFVGQQLMSKALKFVKQIDSQIKFDLQIVKPEKDKQISIEQIRNLEHILALYPYASPWKIAIIDQAEKMTTEAGNALLKTLEEPSGNSVIILLTSSIRSILPTIVSRCQVMKFLLANIEEVKRQINDYQKFARDFKKLITSDLAGRFSYAEKNSKDKEKLINMLNTWLLEFREFLIKGKSNWSQKQLTKIMRKIQQTIYLISRTNTNPRLAMEVLLWEFEKT